MAEAAPIPVIPPEIADLVIDDRAPLLIVDVDEVLARFMASFERFVAEHGVEMRITRFALFESLYPIGETQSLDPAAGRALFDAFFKTGAEDIEVVEGAADALASIAADATVVILTNAPAGCRGARERWLRKHGLTYPLIVNFGLKGPPVAALAGRTVGPVAFVDDLLPHLESVAVEAPRVRRFQTVADERLRPFAPAAPDRHARHDDWPTLGAAIAASLGINR